MNWELMFPGSVYSPGCSLPVMVHISVAPPPFAESALLSAADLLSVVIPVLLMSAVRPAPMVNTQP